MGNDSNISGEAGEIDCASELMAPIAQGGVLFRSIALGRNEPTADLLVFLLTPEGKQSGPFFFLQIKTTSTGPRPDGSYDFTFGATDVRRAQAMKVPFFLCIVDRSIHPTRRMFLKGVDSRRKRGIYRLVPKHDLTTDAVKRALHDEVKRIWAYRRMPSRYKHL